MHVNKQVFISYSWLDMKIADQIEQDLSMFQLTLVRDVRNLEYKQSISSFMERIRDADFAILLISDSYLRSKNCMKEVLHLLEERNYEEKVLPIMVKGTQIYTTQERLKYTTHWVEERENLSALINSMPVTAIVNEIAELKTIETIASKTNEFLAYISDKKNLTFDELKDEGYVSILSCLGVVNISHLLELSQISLIQDINEKEIALDQWFEENSPTSDAYSIRASIAKGRGNIKKAEIDFEKALQLNGENAYALNNYGYMLLCKQIRPLKAKELFELAIKVIPTFTTARLNLGVLLSKQFDDHKGAKEQYEKVISYNPTEEKAYNNLANYYKKNVKNTQKNRRLICDLYEKAISLEPNYIEAHLAYGVYLSESIGQHEKALEHYDEVLRIDQKSAELIQALKTRLKNRQK
ncbi:toll/interleukin-1 receptor domain-containing protein [Pseudoalteromonas luteoviolacea]|uniref:TIR domain-containing protein n=1 Tax=Pseudoalteromonas luteoviolacea S4060-1 TaxID=1365257 RepID=A0A167P4Z2_9GAMM|nr:tetratricopeptide repeat protein [Pseudoalteromonas luteoviolacea]KZN69456.1 hypothetical protein N478_12550 [Pseudoalteromonas luteoviolacea S4060-1]